MDNDSTLIYRAQAGDEGAFVDLIRAYHPFVYTIVIAIVNNPQDAEEIVQDTFLNVYRGLAQYEDRAKFKTWLAEIARNCARSWMRKQRINTVPIDELSPLDEVSKSTVRTQDLPDEQLIHREQRELIRRAIESLSPMEREIARSYYLEGASYDELTSAHGLSYKAISVRLSRAKQKLAKRLGHLLPGMFVSPIPTLKQIYSGGLTVMKVGTVPKITAGIVAIIVLALIGTRQFISSKEDLSPSVEVVTSTPTESANSVAQRDTIRKGAVTPPSREDKPQLSADQIEQIEDFFAQLDEAGEQSETDTPQLPTDTEVVQNSVEHVTSDTDSFAEHIEQSAEDVMSAYVEAFRNLDFEALLPLLTGTAKEDLESDLPDLKNYLAEINANKADPVLERMIELTFGRIDSLEVVSSEYVGDEFHCRMRMLSPQVGAMLELVVRDLPQELRAKLPQIDIPELPESSENVVKMRKENGVWRIYDH